MEYAIVDIETTGGFAAGNDITEIAIFIHDGEKVVDRFSSLVKPVREIPYYIQVLTGITPEMVETAPSFTELAPVVYQWLKGRVFVAHNVNFDYSFVKYHLQSAGYPLSELRLCTVRLARKVFPGLPSYSLGNLCKSLEIPLQDRHRAGGDAAATVRLFELMLTRQAGTVIKQMLKKGTQEQWLPTNLSPKVLERIPYTAGVYYFLDQKGKVLYVGKAKNLKYRVKSHFTHNGAGKQRQEFLRNIHAIDFQECGTELMAFILENVEIKRLWPPNNSSQKRVAAAYGLYDYEDQNGYIHLVIDRHRKGIQPLYSFGMLVEGHRLLKSLIEQFKLCPKLCYIQTSGDCEGVAEGTCSGACMKKESPASYNLRVNEAVEYLENNLPSFAIVDKGLETDQVSCVLIEKGKFFGMGYIPQEVQVTSSEILKDFLTPYPDNDYIRALAFQYAEKNPHKKISFNGLTSI